MRTTPSFNYLLVLFACSMLCTCDTATEIGSVNESTVNVAADEEEIVTTPEVEIDFRHVAGNVYMLVGTGGNVAVSVGDDGVLIVDSLGNADVNTLLAAISRLSDQPVRRLINTHYHPDHSAGNQSLAGKRIKIIAHSEAHERMLETGNFNGDEFSEIITEETTIRFNGEEILLIPVGPAHTDNDLIVYFQDSNVIHSGDIFGTVGFPVADNRQGGSLLNTVTALNTLIDTAKMAPGFLHGEGNRPGAWPDRQVGDLGRKTNETDTMIIPGHGRLADETDVTYYRDMLAIIRDRIADMIGKGMSLEEIKTARPAFGWEQRYKHQGGMFDYDRFIDTLYAELTANPTETPNDRQ